MFLLLHPGYIRSSASALPTPLHYLPTRDIFALIGLRLAYAMHTPPQSVPTRDPSSSSSNSAHPSLRDPVHTSKNAYASTSEDILCISWSLLLKNVAQIRCLEELFSFFSLSAQISVPSSMELQSCANRELYRSCFCSSPRESARPFWVS